MRRDYWKSRGTWLAAGAIALGSCSQDGGQSGSKLADSATFEPAPVEAERDSVEARLSRYDGQTSFLNYLTSFGKAVPTSGTAESATMDRAGALQSGTAQRDIQEADIYKIKPDSKILYLLNNYRGLQVVDFSDGAEKPTLKARVPATGNHPESMYYDQVRDRLVVVERYSVDETGETDYSSEKSRILVYKVDENGARITQSVEFYGSVADNRLVGDVLYVAASYRGSADLTKTPGEFDRNSVFWGTQEKNKPRGVVYSYKLGDDVTRIATHELQLPTYRENMNIVEVPAGEELYNYYLVATVSDSNWWSRSPSAIEVLDITDPRGKVEPVMVAGTRGRVAERSSTKIKDNTLVAVSSFRQNEQDWQSPQLIAVETFEFPSAEGAEVADSEEVKYRKLHIERELEKEFGSETSSDAYLAAKAELEADPELGIDHVFERTDDGKIVNIKAESVKTVRDSRGQSASLQDVRWYEDYLYVFWTPADLVDPLEVFDISNPSEGTPHLGHLEFEGWIQRAFPIGYNGRDYIIGLGQVVPTIDNERGFRHPQVMLYEVVRRGDKTKLVVQDELVFEGRNIWTQFNDQDKMVELNVTDPAKGEGYILFKASQYEDNKYVSGGKLLGFNLSKIDDLEVFSEGSLLRSEWGYLRRVFSNPELGSVINTFSDQQLQVFARTPESLGGPSEVSKAISALELARNIEAYQTLSADRGVQIVTKGSVYWWSSLGSQEAKTELRLVEADQADARVEAVKQVVELDGQYQNHHYDGEKLVVVTQTTKQVKVEENGESYTQTVPVYNVYGVQSARGALTATEPASWETSPQHYFGGLEDGLRIGWGWYAKPTIVKLEQGDYLVAANSEIRLAEVGTETVTLSEAKISGCDLADARQADVKVLNGNTYLHYYYQVDSEGKRVPREQGGSDRPVFGNHEDGYDINYAEYYVATLDRDGNAFSCADAVNIPGEPVAVQADHVVVNDNRLISKQLETYGSGEDKRQYWQVVTHQVLGSLAWAKEDKKATLVDMFDPYRELGSNDYGTLHTQWVEVEPMQFVFVEQKPYEAHRYTASDDTDLTFSSLGFDSKKHFTKSSKVLDLGIGRNAQLKTVKATELGYVGVVASGRRVAAITWSDAGISPLKLHSLQADGEWSEPADYGVLTGYFYGEQVDVNAAAKTINVANGLYGVSSFKILSE